MLSTNYRVISFEGGDQFGKADAVLTFSQKFLNKGVSVGLSSFPIYASPFGSVIRKFLNRGLTDFHFDPKKELKIKMALYALDRLQFLDVVLTNQEYKKILILLDRSSFSNAVTIAYGVVNIEDMADKEVNSLVKYALWLDSLMIKKLQLKRCVVQMVSSSNSWINLRGENNDINENEKVQMATESIYRLYQKKIGNGWKRIVTKTEKGWEDREDIFNNIYNFAVNRLGGFNLEVFPKEYIINIKEIIQNSYPDSKVESKDINLYLESMKGNNKDVMYEKGTRIGEQIGSSTEQFILHNEEIREKFCKIIEREPEILIVLEKYLGINFEKRIKESLNKWTREK